MKIGAIEVIHPVCWVLKDLSSPCNLGYMFLRKHKISVLLDGTEPVLHHQKGQVELIQAVAPENSGLHFNKYTPDELSKLKLKTVNSRIKNVDNIVKKVSNKSFSIRRKQSGGSYKGQLALGCQLQGKITPVKIAENRILLPQSMTKLGLDNIPKRCKSILIENLSLCADNEVLGMPGVYPVRNGKARIMVMNLKEQPKLIRKNTPLEVNELREGSFWSREGINDIKDQQEINVQELYDKLKIEENEMLKEHPKIKRKLKSLIYKYSHIFATPEHGVGRTDVMEASIKLKEGTVPVYQKPRVMNPRVEAEFEKQVDDWLKQGIVQPSKSPWSNPVVAVTKKSGETRFCLDFRQLNKSIIRDSYPLPRIDVLIDKCAGHKIYSALDAAHAYFTIPLEAGSREYTAFPTSNGLLEFLRLPFGISTAVSIYSRFIRQVLNPLSSKGLNAYLDDLLLFHNRMEDHLNKLEEVFQAHEAAGIKLKAEKCQLFRSELVYLGHLLTPQGVQMVPEYVEKILSWPTPKTPKELSRWLGFTSYYRSFIPGFSSLTQEMSGQKKKKNLEWTPVMESKFQRMKEAFKEAPLRAAPDFNSKEEFILTTDYSGGALSAILSQVQKGKERLIAAGGRKTTTGERNYPSWKGELAAIVYGCRKYNHILSYKPFVIYTDSAALKQLNSLKPTEGKT